MWTVLLSLLVAAIVAGVFGYMLKSHKSIAGVFEVLGFGLVMLYAIGVASTVVAWIATYRWIYAELENAGWAPHVFLLKAMVALLTGISCALIPTIVMSIFTFRYLRALALVTAANVGGCLLLFALAKPSEGQIANLKTGASLKNCYTQADGTIEIFPEAELFHPHYPETRLVACTADMIRKYDEQQKRLRDGSPFEWILFRPVQKWVSGRFGSLNLWVEGLQSNDRQTLLHLAVAGRVGGGFAGDGLLRPAVGYAYLADHSGHIYKLLEDKAEYPEEIGKDKKTVLLKDRRILPGQIYRFVLVFPPLGSEVKEGKALTLYHPQFPALQILLNPPPDHNVELAKVVGTAPVEWFQFCSIPDKVVSNGQAGGGVGQGIVLRVEQIGRNNNGTILTIVAVTTTYEAKRLFSVKANIAGTFLQDEAERKYGLVDDFGQYQQEDGQPPYHEFTGSYRFSLVFKPISPRTTKVTFSHWQFPPIDIILGGESSHPVESPASKEAVN